MFLRSVYSLSISMPHGTYFSCACVSFSLFLRITLQPANLFSVELVAMGAFDLQKLFLGNVWDCQSAKIVCHREMNYWARGKFI